MKALLFLALMLSSYSYAQSSHDHQGGMHDGDHQGGMGGMHGGQHGGMGGMHGGHHKLDQTALKQFFEPLPAAIIDEKKNAALIKLGKKLYLEPGFRSMIRFPVILVIGWIISV
ncbi:hypothetical protein [Nitrosomonas sp.]|uniref:hypothetical protein n=1 Tax=Nitrosomonas sp. TaxID=42353 RepID=UPI002731192F|nr:hypothetical protein [Nitrosomonas sp.]MDP2225126.1 hypothetical protein [Nitrosomonas sp.]